MEWLLTGETGRTVDDLIRKANLFQGVDPGEEANERSRRAVEAADEYLMMKRNEKLLTQAAASAETLGKILREAEAELERLKELLK